MKLLVAFLLIIGIYCVLIGNCRSSYTDQFIEFVKKYSFLIMATIIILVIVNHPWRTFEFFDEKTNQEYEKFLTSTRTKILATTNCEDFLKLVQNASTQIQTNTELISWITANNKEKEFTELTNYIGTMNNKCAKPTTPTPTTPTPTTPSRTSK